MAYQNHVLINAPDDKFLAIYLHQLLLIPIILSIKFVFYILNNIYNYIYLNNIICIYIINKLTCLKSWGLDIANDFGLPGVPPRILDIKFFGFIVPYPFISSNPSPIIYKIAYFYISYKYTINTKI